MNFLIYYPRAMVGDGGATRTMWQWAQALAEKSHNVRVVFDGQNPLNPHNDVDHIGVAHIGVGRLRFPRRLKPLLSESIVILHSGFVPGNALVAGMARLGRRPYVVMPQGAYLARNRHRKKYFKLLWRPFERRILEKAAAVHISFPSEASDVLSVARRCNFIVAPAGVAKSVDRWFGRGGYFAWFGRYDIYAKGIDLLVGAWKRIPESERPRLRLRGKESINSLSQVQDLINQYHLGDWVSAGGPVRDSEKEEFLAESLGCIFPSRGESHSLALTEALRLGIPSVVTNMMPIAAELSEFGAAIVVEPDPSSVVAGVRHLQREASLISERARQFVDRELDWEKSVRKFTDELDRSIH